MPSADQSFTPVQALVGFANLAIQNPPRQEISEPQSDTNIPDKKIEEFRRSLFVPAVPAAISTEYLIAEFRSFGSLQECIVKEKENVCPVISVIFISGFSRYPLSVSDCQSIRQLDNQAINRS